MPYRMEHSNLPNQGGPTPPSSLFLFVPFEAQLKSGPDRDNDGEESALHFSVVVSGIRLP